MNRAFRKVIAMAGIGLALAEVSAADFTATRIFRAPRHTRGNTNLLKIQPIDYAQWIWHPDDLSADIDYKSPLPVMVFENEFEVKDGEGAFEIDVSADERYHLSLDGDFIGRGPNRGSVENWQYNTYRIEGLRPGRHRFRAVVTRLGDKAPLAQLSYRGGFILKASGAFDERVSTGVAKWSVAWWKGLSWQRPDNGVWGTGAQFVVDGSGPFAAVVDEKAKTAAVVVRSTRRQRERYPIYGGRSVGWMLFPSQLPDQTERRMRPGEFRAATYGCPWRTNHVYTAAETALPVVGDFNRLLKGGTVTIPASTRVQLAWHLGEYTTAYPELRTRGGAGARVSLSWTESTRDPATKRKGDRREIVGHYLDGYGDTFRVKGGEETFSTPWFRCGLWCRLDIETAAEPLELASLELIENRYPVELESEFVSPDDPSLADIRRISSRAMQMCAHEMLFDCPYYEQQMYPGDTRIQLKVLSSMSRDDRLIRRAIELYDLATRDDGMCPFNFPSRNLQEGFTYTQCYLLMYADYIMNHSDREWLRSRLPGFRKAMAGCEFYENAEGLVEQTPGWNFMDWTVGWDVSGVVKGSDYGRRCNSFVNLMWLLDQQAASKVERALGNELQAKYWEEKSERLRKAIVARFWDGSRGLFRDTAENGGYSEHSQALAIIAEVLPEQDAETCFRHLVEDPDLYRTTVYFSYYLFEAYFKMGRADLFQRRLDLWRGYVARGITTLSEMPDTEKMEGRSDCHAWGAHPIYFMQTGLAGIGSAAPWFERVLVAPQPGTLKSLRAKHPHPLGWIDVELSFDGDGCRGTVTTPVPGEFRWRSQTIELGAGSNAIDINRAYLL